MAHTDPVTAIPEADIRAELDRILASKGFATAGRLSKLLRYVVEKTLAGETDQLKEYSVGVEVFDRDEKYDPRLDSIVRVEAGRLRTKLDEYYNGLPTVALGAQVGDGSASPVRISLPKGGYSAQFSAAARGNLGEPSRNLAEAAEGREGGRRARSRAAAPLAAVLLMAIGAMVFWLGSRDRTVQADLRPTVAVLPFEANMIGGDNSNYSALITEAVTSELARLGTISVASYTSAMQFEGQRRPMSEIATALRSAYVVEASVDDEASEILVVARIVDTATDRKMWVSDYRGARDDVRGIASRMAFDVSAAILERERTAP